MSRPTASLTDRWLIANHVKAPRRPLSDLVSRKERRRKYPRSSRPPYTARVKSRRQGRRKHGERQLLEQLVFVGAIAVSVLIAWLVHTIRGFVGR